MLPILIRHDVTVLRAAALSYYRCVGGCNCFGSTGCSRPFFSTRSLRKCCTSIYFVTLWNNNKTSCARALYVCASPESPQVVCMFATVGYVNVKSL